MRLSVLAALFVTLVLTSESVHATPPAAEPDSERLGELHDKGRQLRDAGDHLGAADQWLLALDAVPLVAAAREDVKNHFCEAVQSLTDADANAVTRAGVRGRIDPRRARLLEGATFIAQNIHPADGETCLAQWTTLAATYPPATDKPAIAPQPEPVPPSRASAVDPRRQLKIGKIGLYTSLGVTLLATAAALGTGLSLAHDARGPDRWQGPTYAAVFAASDPADHDRSNLCAQDLINANSSLDAPCRDFDRVKAAAIASTTIAAAGLVSTAVFAGLVARHRTHERSARNIRLYADIYRGHLLLRLRMIF